MVHMCDWVRIRRCTFVVVCVYVHAFACVSVIACVCVRSYTSWELMRRLRQRTTWASKVESATTYSQNVKVNQNKAQVIWDEHQDEKPQAALAYYNCTMLTVNKILLSTWRLAKNKFQATSLRPQAWCQKTLIRSRITLMKRPKSFQNPPWCPCTCIHYDRSWYM